MQITGLGTSSALTGILNSRDQQIQKILQKLATGLAINQASDDAAGLAMSQEMESQIRGYKAGSDNVSAADAAMNITQGTEGQTSEILQRQRDLAIQASNGTLTDTDRGAINAEFQQLTQQLDQQANGAQYNTQSLANGTGLATGTAQIQANPDVNGAVTAPQVNLTSNALGTAGASVATAGQAQSAINSIDNALKTLNVQQSTVGAFVNRLDYENDNLNTQMINTQAAQSMISDQDMAQGITDLSTQKLLSQTATAAFALFNQVARNQVMGLMGSLQ